MAEPSVNTTSEPNSTRTKMIGAIHNFFRSIMNPIKSFSSSIINKVSQNAGDPDVRWGF